jgi:adenylosuccinate synthase
VVVDGKKFAFHLLPCGLVYPHTTNLLGNGTVVHLPSLFNELKDLDDAGVDWKGRLKISDRAHILFDFHKVGVAAVWRDGSHTPAGRPGHAGPCLHNKIITTTRGRMLLHTCMHRSHTGH